MKKLFGFIALLAVLAAAGLWLPIRGRADPPEYRTALVERADLAAVVSASGTLNAVVLVDVGSQVSGQVKELYADFNSIVRRGQVIALIDPETFEAKAQQARAELEIAQANVAIQQAQLAKSRAELDDARAGLAAAQAQTEKAKLAIDDAKRDLDRKAPLAKTGTISASDWDKARNAYRTARAQADVARAQERAEASAIRSSEAGVQMAEAQLANAQAQVKQKEAALRQTEADLDHTRIRAPVDGVVVSRNVNRGQTVAASLQAPTLFSIAQDLTRMQVDASVVEADVGRIAVGQSATFTVDAYPSRRFTGKVIQIRKAPQVVQNVVTYDVVISADNQDQILLPGMTANLDIVVARKSNVRTIPNAALRFRPPGVRLDEGRSAGSPAGGEGEPGLPGRVYIPGADGSPERVAVRLGITDGHATELLGHRLAEGQPVIVSMPPAGHGSGMRFPRLF
jgi:HlyD family secretion protein